MHTGPTRSVLMKQIPSQQYKVHFGISGDLKNLSKGIDGVLTSNWVFFSVTYVIVRREEDSEATGDISVRREINNSEELLVRF